MVYLDGLFGVGGYVCSNPPPISALTPHRPRVHIVSPQVFKNKKTPLRYMCKGVDRSWTEDLLQAEVRAVQGTAAAWANTLPHRFKRVHFTGMLLHISVYIQSIFSLYSVYIQSIFSAKIAKMTFCTVQATAPTLHTRGCRGRREE